MAFLLPRNPLSPTRALSLGLDPSAKVVRAAELGVLRNAEQAIVDAQAQAQAILDQAQAAFDAERHRGYLEGLEQARMEQAEQMTENVMRAVDYFSKVEVRMVDLVMQAVQRIISDFDDSARIVMTVKNVLSVVRNQKQMTLRLHPDQVDTVKAHVNDLLAAYPGVGYLDIVADHRLKPDACILESEIGLVEGSMEGQLTAIRAAFQKVLGSRI